VRGRKGIYTELFRAPASSASHRHASTARYAPCSRSRAGPVSRARHRHRHRVLRRYPRRHRAPPDLVATALRLGSGAAIAASQGEERIFSERLYCARCGIGYEDLDPRLFSFNSRQGACADCDGIGSVLSFEPEFLVEDAQHPLGDALAAVLKPLDGALWRDVARFGTHHKAAWKRAAGAADEKQRQRVFRGAGAGNGGLVGVCSSFIDADEEHAALLAPFMTERACAICHGRRLNARAQAVTVDGVAIWELTQQSVAACLADLSQRPLSGRDEQIAANIRKEILPRLHFLQEVGLSYLTLDGVPTRCRAARRSAFAWRRSSARTCAASATSSTSRPSGCTRATTPCCSAR